MLFGLSDPLVFLYRIITLVISLTVHEFAHAYTAVRFGDETPRMYGRLTLNPLAHLDLMGSLMMLIAGFGWAKPVPVNPGVVGRQGQAALMWVSLAGPLSNFVLAILGAIPLRLMLAFPTEYSSVFGQGDVLLDFFIHFVFLNLVLMLFNLIPIAPLDGDKIADYFFPPTWARVLERIRPYGPLLLLAIVFLLPRLFNLPVLDWILMPPLQSLFDILVFKGA